MERFKEWFLENTNDFWATYKNLIDKNDLPILADYLQDKGYDDAGKYLAEFLNNPTAFVFTNAHNSNLCKAFSEFPDLTSIILERAIRSQLPRRSFLSGGYAEIEYPILEENNIVGTTTVADISGYTNIVFRFSYSDCFIDNFEISLYDADTQQQLESELETQYSNKILNALNISLKPYFSFCNNFC